MGILKRTNKIRARRPLIVAGILAAAMVIPACGFAQQATTPHLPSQSQATPAEGWSEIDNLGGKLATEIARHKLNTVFVVGGIGPKDTVSELGVELRDALSDSLARQAKGTRVIDPATLRTMLKNNRVSEAMLYRLALADWMMANSKSDGFVSLYVENLTEENLYLKAELIGKKKKALESLGVSVIAIKLVVPQLLASSRPRNPSVKTPDVPVDQAGERGAGEVTCIYCPRPDYTPVGKEKRIEGEVLLEITVRSDGTVDDIIILKPLGFGLDGAAVDVVQKYRFKPAMKDGHPIPVQANIQIIYRLY